MKPTPYIQRNWRLLCTSLALLLVLTVNHRALPAYAAAVPAGQKTSVKTTGHDADHSVVKQKVSFEATTSFIDINLQEPALLARITFAAPLQKLVPATPGVPYWAFFLQQLATLPISPNAP
ncbi:hypothetical protein [Rufibacter sp. LB8]|uniref:hypothetical protein n=1 Tax=Rufibacter sp. LB8 TaxID=2777781 RepID=UPI00178C18DA|nr:hypothetical protein [Rufibacter sp. LB8]